ncbi:MAG: hypothetical protein HY928_18275 [Elusimicrobia bacterium]|nr:hypothetical protein [Elusimicrobiota bacterium]
MTANPPRNPARLHSLRVVAWDRALAEGCDVMLEISEGVMSTGPAALQYSRDTGRQANCGITGYSAYTKNWVLKSAASAPDCMTLQYNLKRDFQPGTPSYKAIGFGTAASTAEGI